MHDLRIRLFGPPTIELDGEPVDAGRRMVVALAAYLSANEAAPSREGICALLWPEKSDDLARAELRRTISALRSCAGPGFVEATRSRVGLNPEVWVDVREFRSLMESVNTHYHDSGEICPDCVRAMENAASLFSADFLAGFSLTHSSAFDDWMIFEAERLRDSLAVALERLSRPAGSDGGPREATAIEYARRWLQLDNLNEAAYGRLMTLYALSGQRGTALKIFTDCENILAEELGSTPGVEIVELKRRIRAGSLTPPPASSPGPNGKRAAPAEATPRGRRQRTERRIRRIAIAAALAAAVSAGIAYRLTTVFSSRSRAEGIPVAVLPLIDDSSDSKNQWFADGMTDAIITDLAKIRALRVTSHTSVDAFTERRPPIPEIHNRLGVDYVVEGSVLKADSRVRITAQLIDAKSDRHLWADEYESELTDIIDLQGRIAEDIASHVSARLSPNEKGELAHTRPVDPRAYEAYLLGDYELARLPFDTSVAGKCLADLKRSIEIDDSYAPAHAALANYYWGATQFGLYSNEEGMTSAEREAERAVALDGDLSDARTVLGFISFLHDYNWRVSEREFQRAIALKPSSAEAHCWYGSLLCTLGRFDEAIAEVTKARQIDPLSLINILNVAMRLYYARDYEEAIRQASVARDMETDFYMSHLVLGYVMAAEGSYDKAAAELEKAAELAGDGAMEPLAVLSYVYNRAGRPRAAERAEQRFDALGAKGMSLSPLLRAYIPLGRGDYDGAMNLIEQAYAEHDLNLAWNFQDPFFDPLRSLPRFTALKRKMKL